MGEFSKVDCSNGQNFLKKIGADIYLGCTVAILLYTS